MDAFSKFHPAVIFSFFMVVIVLSVLYINPVYLLMSFSAGFLYYLVLKGKAAFSFVIKCALPVIFLAAVFNMLFCRYGETVLFSVKGINFTAECLTYGFCTGVMMAAVILWFACYQLLFTSEKLTALSGRLFPNAALLFSMTLRFLVRMKTYADEMKEAQAGLGNETKGLKNTLKRFSALVSVSLEGSIETADVMRQRGYENKNKTFFSRYAFKPKDAAVLICIAALFIVLAVMKGAGFSAFEYRPALRLVNENHVQEVCFFILAFSAVFIDFIKGVQRWHRLKSKT